MRRIFFIIFISAFAIGCKKDTTAPEKTTDYLSKTTAISGTDTTVIRYEYNAENRLSKIIYGDDKYKKIEYYASGEIAIIDSYYNVLGSKFRTRVVFSYDKSDVIKSAVSKLYVNSLLEDIETFSYKVDSNRVVEIESDKHLGLPTFIKYDVRGNVLEVLDHVNGTGSKFTYNDKSSRMINSRVNFYLGSDALLPVDIYNHNDCVKIEKSSVVTEIVSQYNDKDLPTKSVVNETSGSGTTETAVSYEYIIQ